MKKGRQISTLAIQNLERQVLDRNPDDLICDLQQITTGWTTATTDQFDRQVRLLRARHLYISERMNPRRIAKVLQIDEAAEVYHWVELYGWQEHRQRREVRRSKRFATTREVNAFVLEQQVDSTMSKACMVANDLLEMHLNEEVRLDPNGLQAIVNSTKTIFEVRGAIKGSDKIGEKWKIELSADIQHSLGQMLQHVQPGRQKLEGKTSPELQITVEDAEFTEADRA